jgi:hypothetical protein
MWPSVGLISSDGCGEIETDTFRMASFSYDVDSPNFSYEDPCGNALTVYWHQSASRITRVEGSSDRIDVPGMVLDCLGSLILA